MDNKKPTIAPSAAQPATLPISPIVPRIVSISRPHGSTNQVTVLFERGVTDEELQGLNQVLGVQATNTTPHAGAAEAVKAVPMPKQLTEALLLVGSRAHRAALNQMTGSDGHVVKKTYEAMFAYLAEQPADAAPAPRRAKAPVLMPKELDDALWRAGCQAFRAALIERTGMDMYVVRQTYAALYKHLAARAAQTTGAANGR